MNQRHDAPVDDAIHTAATLRTIAATMAYLRSMPTWQRVLIRSADMLERLASRPSADHEAVRQRAVEDLLDGLYKHAAIDHPLERGAFVAGAWLLDRGAMAPEDRAALRKPANEEGGEMAASWPNGCIKRSSCARNGMCMYGHNRSCRHEGRDIRIEVEAAGQMQAGQ